MHGHFHGFRIRITRIDTRTVLGLPRGNMAQVVVTLRTRDKQRIEAEAVSRRVGHKMPESVKKKLALIHNGAKRSEETKRKMSEARKGRDPWNKGLKTKEICR